jgi:hypothetical protein
MPLPVQHGRPGLPECHQTGTCQCQAGTVPAQVPHAAADHLRGPGPRRQLGSGLRPAWLLGLDLDPQHAGSAAGRHKRANTVSVDGRAPRAAAFTAHDRDPPPTGQHCCLVMI